MSWGELPVATCMLLPNICIPEEYKCTGNIQGLHFAKYHRAVVPDRYKTYTYRPQYELLKILADSNISFKAIDLKCFSRIFFGSVECAFLEKLLNSVIVLNFEGENIVVNLLLNIIFTTPSCQVKYLNVGHLDVFLPMISPFNLHCNISGLVKYSIFSRPTFKELTISNVHDILMDSLCLYHATVLSVSLSSYIEI